MTETADVGVIFDLDGVIVSTDHLHFLAWKALADRLDIAFTTQDNEALRGISRMASLDLLLGDRAADFTAAAKAELADWKNTRYRELLETLTPEYLLPGALGLVTSLKARGVPVAIGSSSRNAPMILNRIGVTELFDAIVDGNHISRSKPDPDVFLLAARALHLAPGQCIVIEDAVAGVDAGVAAGMRVLAVGSAQAHPGATWRAADLSGIDPQALGLGG